MDTKESTNVSKLSVALLIWKMLMENEEKFNFMFYSNTFCGELIVLEIWCRPSLDLHTTYANFILLLSRLAKYEFVLYYTNGKSRVNPK